MATVLLTWSSLLFLACLSYCSSQICISFMDGLGHPVSDFQLFPCGSLSCLLHWRLCHTPNSSSHAPCLYHSLVLLGMNHLLFCLSQQAGNSWRADLILAIFMTLFPILANLTHSSVDIQVNHGKLPAPGWGIVLQSSFINLLLWLLAVLTPPHSSQSQMGDQRLTFFYMIPWA